MAGRRAPCADPQAAPSQSGHFKVREERELEVADGAAMRAVLEGLGYAVGARARKSASRGVWRMWKWNWTRLPFAEVVELRARPRILSGHDASGP